MISNAGLHEQATAVERLGCRFAPVGGHASVYVFGQLNKARALSQGMQFPGEILWGDPN
jgi:hypothetical protein